MLVHLRDGLQRLLAASHIGLIGHEDEKEAGLAQQVTGFRRFGVNPECVRRLGREGEAVPNLRDIEHPVAVEKNRAPHGADDSHLVVARLRSGCETSRCQMTA